MLEIEVKLPVSSREETEEKLLKMGFQKEKEVLEEDLYFVSPVVDFRKSDEALRIRTIQEGERKESVITYKGPKLDAISMTRKELETPVGDAETAREILRSLGFSGEFPVRKLRRYFSLGEVHGCLDEVEGLGPFLELEILKEEESRREEALKRIEEILKTLGTSMTETTRVSYLSQLMKKKGIEWK